MSEAPLNEILKHGGVRVLCSSGCSASRWDCFIKSRKRVTWERAKKTAPALVEIDGFAPSWQELCVPRKHVSRGKGATDYSMITLIIL